MMHTPVEQPRTLLVVEDDATFRTRLVRAFTARGLEVVSAGSHEEAMDAARADAPELALVDLRLPTKSGLDVVRDLKAVDPTTTVVVLTGYGSIATAVEAMKAGAATYLTKPVDADQILAAFENLPSADPGAAPLPVQSLARVEWEHIQRVITECGGNLSQAARLLGIHRRSLQRKLTKNPQPERSAS
jgi:two-component system response regulator RegA